MISSAVRPSNIIPVSVIPVSAPQSKPNLDSFAADLIQEIDRGVKDLKAYADRATGALWTQYADNLPQAVLAAQRMELDVVNLISQITPADLISTIKRRVRDGQVALRAAHEKSFERHELDVVANERLEWTSAYLRLAEKHGISIRDVLGELSMQEPLVAAPASVELPLPPISNLCELVLGCPIRNEMPAKAA